MTGRQAAKIAYLVGLAFVANVTINWVLMNKFFRKMCREQVYVLPDTPSSFPGVTLDPLPHGPYVVTGEPPRIMGKL